jgi:hypothetical protein
MAMNDRDDPTRVADANGNVFAVDGIGALQRIPHDSEAGQEAIEAVVLNEMNEGNRAKWPRGLQHFENASYLLGNHLTRYFYAGDAGLGVHTFGLNDKNPYDNAVAKVADNQLIRPVESVTGLLTEQQPMPRVEPNSDLVEDEDAAEIAEMIVKLTFENPLNMPMKVQESVLNACITGHAIAEVEYTKTGLPIEVPRTRIVKRKNPIWADGDPPDEKEIEVEELAPGEFDVTDQHDIVCRLWNPFHIDVDPAATRPEDITYIIRSSYEDIDWIRDEFDRKDVGFFPERLDNLKPQNACQHVLFWYSRFQDILETPQHYHQTGGLTSGTQNISGGYAPNQTLFSVIDVRPSNQFPRGRTLILAGGKLVYAGDARAWSRKYPWRWHPYAFFPWFKIPGKFWGIPLLTMLVPLQKKINAIDAQVHANRQYISIGQWLIPRHAKMAEGKFSALHGEQFTYLDTASGNKPEKILNPPLSPELLQERDQLIHSIESLAASGVLDTQSIGPSAARAGVMLDFLRQEKLRAKSPLFRNLEKFIECIAQNVLIEYQLNLIEEDPALTARLQQAARDKATVVIENFTGASLRDHHSVSIDIASELMHSPEALEARAMEFLQYAAGLQFLSPEERSALRKTVKIDKLMKNEEHDSVRRARRLVSRIIAGEVDALIPMEGIDVPRAMAPVFRRACLSPRFEEYGREIQAALAGGFDYYAGLIAQEEQQMMQMQMALAQAGVKPGGGGGQ